MMMHLTQSILHPTAEKTYVVFGLGRTGLSAVRWLRHQAAQVLVIDEDASTAVEQAMALGAQLIRDPFSFDWACVTAIIQSPGIPFHPEPHPVTQHARAHNIPIIGDLDLFFASKPHARMIGVTGTNGKSTTTALIGYILTCAGQSVAVGGNIGVPVLDLPDADFYVIEASSYQLDLSPALPWSISVLLNITDDHLDRHKTMAHYVTAKQHIFPKPFDATRHIIGVDTPLSEDIRLIVGGTPISGHTVLPQGVYAQDGHLIDHLTETPRAILNLEVLERLRGAHNYQNIAAAYAASRLLKVEPSVIADGIGTFAGLAHRQEWVATHQNVTIINDSKATNADATATALQAFDNIFWILGGMDKTDGIDALLPYASKIRHAFLIGKASERFAETLTGHVPFTLCETLETAVSKGWTNAAAFTKTTGQQATLLLSPACASFDQFADFEQRGDVFKTYIQNQLASL